MFLTVKALAPVCIAILGDNYKFVFRYPVIIIYLIIYFFKSKLKVQLVTNEQSNSPSQSRVTLNSDSSVIIMNGDYVILINLFYCITLFKIMTLVCIIIQK